MMQLTFRNAMTYRHPHLACGHHSFALAGRLTQTHILYIKMRDAATADNENLIPMSYPSCLSQPNIKYQNTNATACLLLVRQQQ